MTDVEELLRRTFTERERDLAGAAPSLAGVRERSRHRRRHGCRARRGRGRRGRPGRQHGRADRRPAAGGDRTVRLAGPDHPGGAGRRLPRFREEPITSAEGRTSAVIRWAPTWLPDGIGETGRVVSTFQQIRLTVGPCQGPMVRIMSWSKVVAPPRGMDGRPAPLAPVVAGTPATLWSFQRPPHLGHALLPGPGRPGHLVCVPVAAGVLDLVTGTADTAGDALRVAGSIRPAAPAEVAVRSASRCPLVGVGPGGPRRDRPVDGCAGAANAYVELGPPDPDAPPPNTTVDGRPAHLTSSAAGGAVLTVPLGSDLEAVFTAHFAGRHPRSEPGLRPHRRPRPAARRDTGLQLAVPLTLVRIDPPLTWQTQRVSVADWLEDSAPTEDLLSLAT